MFYKSNLRARRFVRREIFFFNNDNRPGFAELELTGEGFLLLSNAAELSLARLISSVLFCERSLWVAASPAAEKVIILSF